jgi:hypothetical protein
VVGSLHFSLVQCSYVRFSCIFKEGAGNGVQCELLCRLAEERHIYIYIFFFFSWTYVPKMVSEHVCQYEVMVFDQNGPNNLGFTHNTIHMNVNVS